MQNLKPHPRLSEAKSALTRCPRRFIGALKLEKH